MRTMHFPEQVKTLASDPTPAAPPPTGKSNQCQPQYETAGFMWFCLTFCKALDNPDFKTLQGFQPIRLVLLGLDPARGLS